MNSFVCVILFVCLFLLARIASWQQFRAPCPCLLTQEDAYTLLFAWELTLVSSQGGLVWVFLIESSIPNWLSSQGMDFKHLYHMISFLCLSRQVAANILGNAGWVNRVAWVAYSYEFEVGFLVAVAGPQIWDTDTCFWMKKVEPYDAATAEHISDDVLDTPRI